MITRLEEEIHDALFNVFMNKKDYNSIDQAKAAAEVAKRYIEKAYHAGYHKAEEGDCTG